MYLEFQATCCFCKHKEIGQGQVQDLSAQKCLSSLWNEETLSYSLGSNLINIKRFWNLQRFCSWLLEWSSTFWVRPDELWIELILRSSYLYSQCSHLNFHHDHFLELPFHEIVLNIYCCAYFLISVKSPISIKSFSTSMLITLFKNSELGFEAIIVTG